MEIANNALIVTAVIVIGAIIFFGLTIVNQAGAIQTYKQSSFDYNAAYFSADIDRNALQTANSDLNNVYSTLLTSYNTLTTNYATLQTQNNTITTALNTANATIAVRDASITTLTSDKNGLNTQVINLTLDKNTLQTKVNDMNVTIKKDTNYGSILVDAYTNCYWAINCSFNPNTCFLRTGHTLTGDYNVEYGEIVQACKDTNKMDANILTYFS